MRILITVTKSRTTTVFVYHNNVSIIHPTYKYHDHSRMVILDANCWGKRTWSWNINKYTLCIAKHDVHFCIGIKDWCFRKIFASWPRTRWHMHTVCCYSMWHIKSTVHDEKFDINSMGSILYSISKAASYYTDSPQLYSVDHPSRPYPQFIIHLVSVIYLHILFI